MPQTLEERVTLLSQTPLPNEGRVSGEEGRWPRSAGRACDVVGLGQTLRGSAHGMTAQTLPYCPNTPFGPGEPSCTSVSMA